MDEQRFDEIERHRELNTEFFAGQDVAVPITLDEFEQYAKASLARRYGLKWYFEKQDEAA